MIQQELVARLKSDLFFQNVGTNNEVSLAVLNVCEGVIELRIEVLQGILACSGWDTIYHKIENAELDIYSYFARLVPKFRNLEVYE